MRNNLALRVTLIAVIVTSLIQPGKAQNSYNPYELKLNKELAYFTTGVVLNLTGLLARTGKPPFTVQQALTDTNTDKIPAFDIGAVEQSNQGYLVASDYALYASLALPLLSLVDGKINDNAVTTIVLYVETMAISSGVYNTTSGIISRRRPLTYNTQDFTIEERTASNVKESFFSGHACISASASFCGAKIFNDFHPHSTLTPIVWTVAATLPAFISFSRYKAGKHFPTDVITGYVVGASIGYLVPALHHIDKKDRLTIAPLIGNGDGLYLSYTF